MTTVINHRCIVPGFAALALLAGAIFSLPLISISARAAHDEPIRITGSFADKEIGAGDRIELRLSRDLAHGEGRFAIFVGEIDLTNAFVMEPGLLSYTPKFIQLPVGASTVQVYLVSPDDRWIVLAELPLKVDAESVADAPAKADPNGSTSEPIAEDPQPPTTTEPSNAAVPPGRKRLEVDFTPTLALNVKGQNQTLTFPREAAPERNPFTDLGGQGAVNVTVTSGSWKLTNQFDLAGSSFQQEALRFGELGVRAPRIDLSSYLVTLEKGKFNLKLGHVSFGSNRHLINSFSSRGVSVTVPLGKQNDLTLAAMNGTSIVGFDNFVGMTRRKHNVVAGTFGREFFPERPNGLRVEFTLMRGSLLPISNFNQREVNDAETSLGFGVKAIGSDTKQRLRYEIGFGRSRFSNPNDPLLSQDQNLTRIRPATRTARNGEISFDFLQGLKLWNEKKLKVTGTYRHEEIQPLFRSIGVSTQADRRQHQFEVAASFGGMNLVVGNLRDRDNLNDLLSILKTFNHRGNVIFNIPLNSFFTPAKPIKWFPQVSYSYDHVHQFGAFLPANGEFRDLSQVPDQDSFSQAFNAVWQLSDKLSINYRYNRAFQDNKQPGRDRADFRSSVNGVAVGLKPFPSLDLDVELGHEQLRNLEQPRTDRTLRIGSRATWRTPLLKNSTFSSSISTTLAGDDGNKNDSRSAEFDVQWAYTFNIGTKKFKKLQSQFFIRYANRYGHTIDRSFLVNGYNKTQAFNMGLTFNVF